MNIGAVAQSVRILACHARGREFESRPLRHIRNKGCIMIVLGVIISFLAIHAGIATEHPGFYKAANNGKAEWHYVGSHDCESGKQTDGAYVIALNGKVHFKQANKDGTVDKVTCSGLK